MPASWEWDLTIQDFASLKDTVLRFRARHDPDRFPRGALGTYAILGMAEQARAEAAPHYAPVQFPNGLFRSCGENFRLEHAMYRSMHELFIHMRIEMGACIHLQRIPEHRLSFLDLLLNQPKHVAGWIESLPWDNPWGSGNLDMDLAFMFAFEWKVMGNPRGRDALVAWFDWHDRHIDPTTGFWDPHQTGDVRRQMAGAMHQFCIYFLFGKELPHPEAAVRATLSLQQDTGLFAADTYSHHGMDVDATLILTNIYHRYGVMQREIRACLERVFPSNLKCFHPDGGGCNIVGVTAPDWWSTMVRVTIAGWCARILDITDYLGPWQWVQRHPFITERGGAGLPDWDDDTWYDAVDWPRPENSSGLLT
jgi:hypothetical protein